ncbi:MAG: hypothetical protein M1358_07275, partial [Chloroflexi bacterium]|nr:hypothetical protein [Chloroflexota bacterium]
MPLSRQHAKTNGFPWSIAIIVSALLLSTLPFLIAYWSTPPGLQFSGFLLNVEDANSHLAKMMLGKRGEWLLYLNYSPEPHDGAFVNTIWILLGQVAGALGLQLVLMWHLARVAFGLVYLITVKIVIDFFVETRAQRLIALFLAVFGSGLGWLLLLFGQQTVLGERPIDFWLAEAYSVPLLVGYPHMLLGTAMLFLTFILALKALETNTLVPGIAAGFCAVAFVLIHPFGIAVVDITLAAYVLALMLKRQMTGVRCLTLLAPVFVLPLPVFLYDAAVFLFNPEFRAWSEQNLCLSPSPLVYLLGYGLLVPLAVLGARVAVRGSNNKSIFLVAWTVAVAGLLYVPFNSQRRLVEGLVVPLAILSARGIVDQIWPYLRQQDKGKLIGFSTAIMLALALPSTLIFAGGLTFQALRHASPTYQDVSALEAIHWLGTDTAPNKVVLSAKPTGNLIPAISGNTVVLGHWAETIGLQEKERLVKSFFSERTNDSERRAILSRFGVSYVLYGPNERALG